MGGAESDDRLIPEPETIYERTKEEGRRRLTRPVAEEISTGLAAGFDIVAGVIVLALLASQLEHHFGKHAAHVAGSLGFGIGFVFLIVGRGELFTENDRGGSADAARERGARALHERILGNVGLAAAGNIVGGVGLVTMNRLTQGTAGRS